MHEYPALTVAKRETYLFIFYEVTANDFFLLDILTTMLNFFPCVFFSFALALEFSVSINE